MLDPKQNSIDYGESLIPPNTDYAFTYAVGTTYSLDLEALLVLPVALFYSDKIEVKKGDISFGMLESITKAAEKMVVYCQKGKVAVPKTYNFLFSFWEKGIEYVTMPTAQQSFHPKIWVIRYDSIEKKKLSAKYKLIISSRNLTYARDWDIAYTSEGEVGNATIVQTKPIADFLRHLEGQGNRNLPKNFIADLEKVSFELPDDFIVQSYFPMGIENYISPLLKKKSEELIIISPFVDKTTIDLYVKNTEKKISVFSRKEELDGLPIETIKAIKAYQFSQSIIDGEYNEDNDEGDGEESVRHNLHAKIYIAQKSNKVSWLLGSANATCPAAERNVEFLVEIQTNNNQLGPKQIAKQLFPGDDPKFKGVPLFEKYNEHNRQNLSKEKAEDLILRKIIFDLCKIEIIGTADKRTDSEIYDINIKVDALKMSDTEYNCKIKPLSAIRHNAVKVELGKKNTFEFKDFSLSQLSHFIIWQIWEGDKLLKEFIVTMEITIDEKRLGKIFSSIIQSSDKFMQYLSFLLTGHDSQIVQVDTEGNIEPGKNMENQYGDVLSGIPLYEKLLMAASRFPDRLKSIDELIDKLKTEQEESKKQIITASFVSFLNIFKTYIEKNAKRKN